VLLNTEFQFEGNKCTSSPELKKYDDAHPKPENFAGTTDRDQTICTGFLRGLKAFSRGSEFQTLVFFKRSDV
jgi:hypothetical protein